MIKFEGDFNTQFEEEVDRMFDEDLRLFSGDFRSHSDRIRRCDRLISQFVSDTGGVPPSVQLDRLASFILKEDTKGAKWKLALDVEYPVLSDRQLRSRRDREASWDQAEYVDLTGVNRTFPTRLNRITLEIHRGDIKL